MCNFIPLGPPSAERILVVQVRAVAASIVVVVVVVVVVVAVVS